MIERIFKALGLIVVSGLMVTWLTGCGQVEEHAHSGHDHDHEHAHDHDGDGSEHDSDGNEHNEGGDTVAGLIDGVDVAAQKAAYPLDTCLVGGEKLGSMGDPVEFVHEGRLVQFCCEGCIDDFKKDSSTYLAKLDEALASAASAVVPETH